MKTFCCVPVAAAMLLAGCGGDAGTPNTATNSASSGGSPLSAPADYLGGLAKSQQSAVKTADTTRLNQAIQLFNVDRGRNPKDLNELVTGKYIPKIPPAPTGMKIVYDANAGTVKVVPQ